MQPYVSQHKIIPVDPRSILCARCQRPIGTPGSPPACKIDGTLVHQTC